MGTSIREARISDAAAIANLTAQLGYEVDTTSIASRLARILDRRDQQFVIAECDDLPIGWLHEAVSDFVETGTFVTIAGLVVDREHRRQGIGGLLMAHAERWAAEKGCAVVRLWSSAARTDAHRFYARLGYTIVKNQYSFAKCVGEGDVIDLEALTPRIE
jgi:GNAT superfamily N-acetyltransferase